MKKYSSRLSGGVRTSLMLGALALPAFAQSDKKLEREAFDAQKETPAVVHWARGQAGPPFGGGTSSPNMTYHNGTVIPNAKMKMIFWGTKWTDPNFVVDKITGLDTFYAGLNGSSYANTNTEYTGSNGQVTSASTYTSAHIIDSSAAPSRAPKTSDILAEVCKKITSPEVGGYYPVYTDTRRGSAGYCAWHSWGTCGTTPIQFAFFFNLDGDTGCSVDDLEGHSQGLAALVNVSGHEYSEAVTDPRGDGWYDKNGYENADKCAWTFSGNPVTLKNGSTWQIQGNWSNAAYNNNTGYTKGGCIDTK